MKASPKRANLGEAGSALLSPTEGVFKRPMGCHSGFWIIRLWGEGVRVKQMQQEVSEIKRFWNRKVVLVWSFRLSNRPTPAKI